MQPTNDAIAAEQASIEIEAPPMAIYEMVTAIDRMREWSPEAVGGRWLDGGGPKVGDWFEGDNRAGEREWSRRCQVAEAEPGRAFTFVVGGIEANCTWWSYELEPTATGTRVTEHWWLVNKTPAMQEATPEQFAGRVELTRNSLLPDTLTALKASAESAG
ncbi:MAG: SRPBCC family protein [Actinomycetota bacterium]